MKTRALLRFGAWVTALACTVPTAGGSPPQPLPHDLVLVLEWGEPRGPASLLEELEREILTALAAPPCFRAVRPATAEAPPAAGELLLRVLIDEYEEEVDFEFALSERAAPDVDTTRLQVARVEAAFHTELRAEAGDAPIRARRFRQLHAWRPQAYEDPREMARLQLIDGAARRVRKLVCKGSLAKRTREVDQAREAEAR